jgi:N-acetylmuramoyl-L-alanine amidase
LENITGSEVGGIMGGVLHRSPAILLIGIFSLASTAASHFAVQGQPAALRVLSREGTRTLAVVSVNNQEYVALDDVAAIFSLAVKEDRLAGGVTVASGSRTIIVTPDQPVVSVAGRLVSLTAPPARQNNRWLVPLDFLQRAVGSVLESRVEVRRPARLVVVGDLRVPRVSVRVETTPSGATATFDISPATPTRVSQEGGRLLVNFEADALDMQGPDRIASQEYLQAVQTGETPSTLRLVPGPRFGVHRATSAQADANTSRLTIELLPAGAEPPAPPVGTAAPPPPTPPAEDPLLVPTSPVPVLRTIVIDPGHGGDDLGARGPGGAAEKEIALQIARRVRTMIESRLGLRVFLTRDDDRPMSLDDRSAYANSQRADIFISVHANAAMGTALKGAEVYYLSPERELQTRSAETQEALLPALGGNSRLIELLPWESAQSRSVEQSSALASVVEQALRARVEMSPRAVQQAPLRVLVGATMPAVLVEVGYLSNPEQERALTSGGYQDQVAQSLFNAVVLFRAQYERGSARPR